ncbi:hypothetical protein [Pseudomonas sp. fls2-241-R2A-110]|uniref:hypothetical protein n=1 Tax=Pseudomonas sp. fls2-241-R2A-110 TaxID=3040311 RepID=UPI002553324E|nr:hypothetical protein [Pseudomonas sp. fls2-241-R2A-110]
MNNTATCTVTAVVTGLPQYTQYKSNGFCQFYKGPMAKFWNADSAHRADQENAIQLSVQIPDNGNNTFIINDDSSDITAARASLTEHSGALIRPFIATSGKLTNVNIDLANRTVAFDFEFVAKSGKQIVEVSQGSAKYAEIEEHFFKPATIDSDQYVTATLEGSTYSEYNANEFNLLWKPDNGFGIRYPQWQGWSRVYTDATPHRHRDTVSVTIADDLVPGTYDLDEYKDKIYAIYAEIDPNGPLYEGTGGTLVLEKTPLQGSSIGVLKGRILNFVGVFNAERQMKSDCIEFNVEDKR